MTINENTHTASRVIPAGPEAIYQAFLSRDVLVQWLPPDGASSEIETFQPYPGGRLRMTLRFDSATGKTSQHTDVLDVQWVELVPNSRIVWAVRFDSDDPRFAGTMTMIWELEAAAGGTRVTVVARDVPVGIDRKDHESAMASTVAKLSAIVSRSSTAM